MLESNTGENKIGKYFELSLCGKEGKPSDANLCLINFFVELKNIAKRIVICSFLRFGPADIFIFSNLLQ